MALSITEIARRYANTPVVAVHRKMPKRDLILAVKEYLYQYPAMRQPMLKAIRNIQPLHQIEKRQQRLLSEMEPLERELGKLVSRKHALEEAYRRKLRPVEEFISKMVRTLH